MKLPSSISRAPFRTFRPSAALGVGLLLVGCGARTELGWDHQNVGGQGGAGSTSSSHTSTSSLTTGSTTMTSSSVVSSSTGGCVDGETVPCGSNVGTCKQGVQTCSNGVFGPCEGEVGPTDELCDGLDNNCNGEVDEGFHLGEPCDGPDTDLCLDDVITCAGCSAGPNNLETCNGKDDNCNGIVDADCDSGDCQPSLLVVGSTPSNPNCIDFPVMAGSMGSIEFPCTGGPVTATLGGVPFTGSVSNSIVNLTGTSHFMGPDGCQWQADHTIQGDLTSGMVTYSYAEHVTMKPPGKMCWQPCTETGTVKIQYQ